VWKDTPAGIEVDAATQPGDEPSVFVLLDVVARAATG
jgi:hypothetical protein